MITAGDFRKPEKRQQNISGCDVCFFPWRESWRPPQNWWSLKGPKKIQNHVSRRTPHKKGKASRDPPQKGKVLKDPPQKRWSLERPKEHEQVTVLKKTDNKTGLLTVTVTEKMLLSKSSLPRQMRSLNSSMLERDTTDCSLCSMRSVRGGFIFRLFRLCAFHRLSKFAFS